MGSDRAKNCWWDWIEEGGADDGEKLLVAEGSTSGEWVSQKEMAEEKCGLILNFLYS